MISDTDWKELKIRFIPAISEFEPIVLPNKDNQQTRKVVKAKFIQPNLKNPEAPLEITISHQRKKSDGSFEDCESFSLSSLPAGKEIRMILDTEQTLALQEILNKLHDYCKANRNTVLFTTPKFSLENVVEIVNVPPNRKEIIEELVKGNFEEEFWLELANIKPDEATKFSYARIHKIREVALDQMKNHLDQTDWNEHDWQKFFEENTWIFGYGLTFKWLNPVGPKLEATTTGSTVVNTGKRPDAFEKVSARIATTVFADIKKPSTNLLAGEYRAGVYSPSNELVGGVVQVQTSINEWMNANGSKVITKDEKGFDKESIYSYNPKGILVVGNLKQFQEDNKDNVAMIQSFELFRRSMLNPEIITFDELYDRASFIILNR